MNSTYVKAAALTLAVSAGQSQAAAAYTLNFDGVASGSAANTDAVALANGISFDFAQLLPDKDAFGDTIPNSDKWQIDPDAPPVLATNPLGRQYGAAPSGVNALEGVDQPVLMHFASPIDLGTFAVTLDNSTFGNPPPSDILFLDANKTVIGTLSTSQPVPGFVGAISAPIFGVKEIVLASGAFYDNITVAPVPVPAAVWLFGSAVGGVLGLRRQRLT